MIPNNLTTTGEPVRVITAPETFYPAMHQGWKSVFLAGAIDMGAAVPWQDDVVTLLPHNNLILLNPRRESFTPDTLDEQVLWELDMMTKADVVMMWFPKDSKAPVAMFESGLWWTSGKLVVGAEPGFYRRRNLELYAQWFGLQMEETLEATCRRASFWAWGMLPPPKGFIGGFYGGSDMSAIGCVPSLPLQATNEAGNGHAPTTP